VVTSRGRPELIDRCESPPIGYGGDMPLLIVVLLLALLLGGLGFALKALWIVAIIVLVVWVIGFLVRPGGKRWYYW
jgi:hypothetical protein